MRLWSLHPRYLDRAGLVAAWREALLAQAVIGRPGAGYSQHPQLIRFRLAPDPEAALGAFLIGIVDEAAARGYRFDRSKIRHPGPAGPLPVTTGQLEFEAAHLRAKLERRAPDWLARWPADAVPHPHPLFRVEPGPMADWERPAAR
ncbi:pyrimidine dimer DNA glycosylase/endonuclease V [Microbacterium kribbense]|uniref:Pyrimidine dimer DNA glycosylase/endonuclease V n=1 Tax=Microbacterium kribbense TaxID=433645 RepID=A0ABP7FZV8_9MICO